MTAPAIANNSATAMRPLYLDQSKRQEHHLPKAVISSIHQVPLHTQALVTFNQQLGELRPILYKIAKMRVRNETWAEDAVSETIMAALEKPEAYSNRSSLRTWLVGILKHKLVDQIHRHTRESQSYEDIEAYDADFNATSWCAKEAHAGWGDPEKSLLHQQFIQNLDICLSQLPPQQAQAFKLRYGLEMEPQEICHQLGISQSNLHVMLFRSRMHIRASFRMQ